jgi:SAM-dependent methyltransferase
MRWLKSSDSIQVATASFITSAMTAFSAALQDMQRRIFDRVFGVETREEVFSANSGTDNRHYQSCQWLPLRRALKKLGSEPSGVFVDLGSGKGKALLIAARLPYRRVVGVEINEELSRCAMRNIERAYARLRSPVVESITASVLEWPVPDDTSVVFMFNAFTGQTFHSALSRVFDSYDRRPRDLHVVYYYPSEHDWLMSTGRVVVDSVRPSYWPARPGWWRSGNVIVSYRVVGRQVHGQPTSRLPRQLSRRQAIARWSRPNGQHFITPGPDGRAHSAS